MTSTVYEVLGHKFVGGLDWSMAQGTAAAAKRGVKTGRAYVVCTSPADSSVSVGEGDKDLVKGKTYSAGAVIARVFQDAIIFAELEDGRYWVCTITGGVPGSAADLVLATEAEAKTKYTEATTLLSSHVKTIGTIRGASMSVAEALTEAVQKLAGEDAKPRQIAAALAPFRVHVQAFNWFRFAAMVTALVVVASAALAGILYREHVLDRKKREALLEQATKTEQERLALKAKRDALVAKFRDEVEQERARFGRREVALSQWSACEAVRLALPLSRYGYLPSKLTCDFARMKADVEWAPINASTRLADRAALPGIVDKYSTTPNALSSFDLKALDAGSPAVAINPDAVQMAILDWAGLRLRTLRVEPGAAVVMSPPKEVADEPGLAPVKLGSKAAISVGATGPSDLVMASGAIRMLNSYAVQLTQVVWTQPSAAGIGMSAKGILYLPDAKL